MRTVAFWISMLALVATVLPAFLYFAGRLTLDQTKLALGVAALVWFVTAPLWMGRTPQAGPTEG